MCGVGRSTFRDRVTKGSPVFDQAVLDALEEGREAGKSSLRRQQWAQAMKGNPTMLIWLGKQLLGQRDYVSLRHGGDGQAPPIEHNVTHGVSDLSEIQDLITEYKPPAEPEGDDPVVDETAKRGRKKGSDS